MSSIITPSDLNSYTPKTLNTAAAKQVLDAVNAYIERVTGRCWGDSVTVTEQYDYASRFWLRHQDVQAVNSVKSGCPGGDLVDIDDTDYYFSPLGRLTFSSYPRRSHYAQLAGNQLIYGVDEVPEDLKLGALGIAAGFYNWADGGQKEVSVTQVGSYRVGEAVEIRCESNPPIQVRVVHRKRANQALGRDDPMKPRSSMSCLTC